MDPKVFPYLVMACEGVILWSALQLIPFRVCKRFGVNLVLRCLTLAAVATCIALVICGIMMAAGKLVPWHHSPTGSSSSCAASPPSGSGLPWPS